MYCFHNLWLSKALLKSTPLLFITIFVHYIRRFIPKNQVFALTNPGIVIKSVKTRSKKKTCYHIKYIKSIFKYERIKIVI